MLLRAWHRWWLVGLLVGLLGQPAARAAEPQVFNMGFYLPSIREANPADIKVSLQVWAEELAGGLGYRPVIRTYDSMAAMREDFNRGDLHFINANGMELAEHFQPGDLVRGQAKQTTAASEGLVLLVNRDSAARTFADLRGKKLLHLSRDRLSEVYLETQCLQAAAQACQVFLRVGEEKRDIQAVYSVFFGKGDAALVSVGAWQAATELNPQIGQRLRVLQEWRVDALAFAYLTRNASPDMTRKMMQAARDVLETPRGRQLLEIFKTSSAQEIDGAALNPYWALLARYQGLLKHTKAKGKTP